MSSLISAEFFAEPFENYFRKAARYALLLLFACILPFDNGTRSDRRTYEPDTPVSAQISFLRALLTQLF